MIAIITNTFVKPANDPMFKKASIVSSLAFWAAFTSGPKGTRLIRYCIASSNGIAPSIKSTASSMFILFAGALNPRYCAKEG